MYVPLNGAIIVCINAGFSELSTLVTKVGLRKYWSVNLSDIDECMMAMDYCGQEQLCRNTNGSFDCVCPSGFLSDGVNCIGILRWNRGARGNHCSDWIMVSFS